jgi:multiple sugar transport system ATP-binding protein
MTADSAGLHVRHLRKTFRGGAVVACDDVDLEIEAGELLVLLGPSGCGKTTTLRCIAGLERPDNDDAVWVKGRNLTRVAPKDRNLAFVFQDTAMFPHLSVRRNVSFGLDMRKSLPRAEVNRRVEQAARMLRIDGLLDRFPRELSGGQGQRAALGRAIVMEPDAFLLDEPLAALDAALRVEMRTEIKLIQRKLATTMIFVTHDQEEALTVGDKIAVMKEGVVQQTDTPHNIYHRPANLFVGSFIGSPPINRFACTLQGSDGELRLTSAVFDVHVPPQIAGRLNGAARQITLGVRPEFVRTAPDGGDLSGRVALLELMGSRTLILVDCGGQEVRVLVQGDPAVKEGDRVGLSLQLERGIHAHRRAAGMLLLGMGYLVLVGTIGYLPAIALLILATARYMGRPWSAQLVLIAAGGALLYQLLFVRLLGIPLPTGIWPALWRGIAG